MSFVLEGLYISSADSALDRHWITSTGITHILTVEAKPLPLSAHDGLKYLYVYALDMEDTDLLHEFLSCCKFIEEARKENGIVLVHW